LLLKQFKLPVENNTRYTLAVNCSIAFEWDGAVEYAVWKPSLAII
jgi:hypothetical protein